MAKDSNARFEKFSRFEQKPGAERTLIKWKLWLLAAENSQYVYVQNVESFLYYSLNTEHTASDSQYFLKDHNIKIV